MSLKKFYADPYYQIRSFAGNAALATLACIALYSLRDASFFSWNFTAIHLLYIPLGIFLGGLSCVYIHNATHQSFANKWLNDACGYLAGLHQLWGYRGWKIIHLIHHQYSDNVAFDPHPTKGERFWPYTRKMFVRSSITISKRYAEQWRDRPNTRLLQAAGLVAFLAQTVSFLAFWFLLLGPVGFVLGYIPSLMWNHIMFAHINFFCHPLNESTQETAAANLNHKLYYKVANVLWHGIYFHGNHHKKPNLFNPRKMPAPRASSRERNEQLRAA
jgi:stearoyl-CoA desaturase (delta-9 desaturase)